MRQGWSGPRDGARDRRRGRSGAEQRAGVAGRARSPSAGDALPEAPAPPRAGTAYLGPEAEGRSLRAGARRGAGRGRRSAGCSRGGWRAGRRGPRGAGLGAVRRPTEALSALLSVPSPVVPSSGRPRPAHACRVASEGVAPRTPASAGASALVGRGGPRRAVLGRFPPSARFRSPFPADRAGVRAPCGVLASGSRPTAPSVGREVC